jgi:hypothetical protein
MPVNGGPRGAGAAVVGNLNKATTPDGGGGLGPRAKSLTANERALAPAALVAACVQLMSRYRLSIEAPNCG